MTSAPEAFPSTATDWSVGQCELLARSWAEGTCPQQRAVAQDERVEQHEALTSRVSLILQRFRPTR